MKRFYRTVCSLTMVGDMQVDLKLFEFDSEEIPSVELCWSQLQQHLNFQFENSDLGISFISSWIEETEYCDKDFMNTEEFYKLNKLQQVEYFMEVHKMDEASAFYMVYGDAE